MKLLFVPGAGERADQISGSEECACVGEHQSVAAVDSHQHGPGGQRQFSHPRTVGGGAASDGLLDDHGVACGATEPIDGMAHGQPQWCAV